MANEPFYAPNLRPTTRMPVAGITVWRLSRGNHVARCEIRNDIHAGAGIDVQLVEGDELLLARRASRWTGATFVAEAFRQDYSCAGWR